MSEENLLLGKLKSVHRVSRPYTRRVFLLAAVFLLVSVAAAAAALIYRSIGYAILAVVFLVAVLYRIYMWFSHRDDEFHLFENGFAYRDSVCLWSEIEWLDVKIEGGLIGGQKIDCEITKTDEESIVLRETIADIENIIEHIRRKMQQFL